MEEELITVVVPLYNMAKYLPRAMKSLLNQDYSNYEIIIVDDGSTDDGSRLADNYANQYERVRCIHKENGGLSSARNVGIYNAHGRYIIFPDPDDWVEKDYLSFLWHLREEYHMDLEICGRRVIDEKSNVLSFTEGDVILLEKEDALIKLMDSRYYMGSAWNKLFRMDVIKKNDLSFDTELGMAQDLHFCVQYFMHCKNVVYDPTPKYFYYQHSGGVTSSEMTLTPRKMSGLRTYEKIAEMTEKDYPCVHDMALATLCNMSLHFIYIYYDKKMTDQKIIMKLRENINKNALYYNKSSRFSKINKLLLYIARVKPCYYFFIKKVIVFFLCLIG